MTIRLHIERLVLDGLALSSRDVAQLGAALEAELLRLILDRGLAPGLAGAALASLAVPAIHPVAGQGADALGRQIAQSLYRGVGQ